MLQGERDVPGLIVDGDFSALVVEVDVAVHAVDGYIAMARNYGEIGVARHVNIQVGADAPLTRTLSVGIQGDALVGDGDQGLGFGVVVVGVGLLLRVDFLAHRDFYRFVVGFRVGHVNGDGAAIVEHMQGAAGRDFVGQFVAVIERGAVKDIVPVIIVTELDVLSQVFPVHARGLCGEQSGDNDEQHQENAADSDAARRLAVAFGSLVFDQLEDAPQNQECRPEAGEERADSVPFENAHGSEQEEDPDQDQDYGAGDRTMWPGRHRRHDWWWNDWTSHDSPPRLAAQVERAELAAVEEWGLPVDSDSRSTMDCAPRVMRFPGAT